MQLTQCKKIWDSLPSHHASGSHLVQSVVEKLSELEQGEREVVEEVLHEAVRFLDEIPDVLGRGSLYGMKVQLQHKIGEVLSEVALNIKLNQLRKHNEN